MSTPASSTSPSPLISTTHSPPSCVPLKCLSLEELALRRDKGLCYHCEEKWSVGHRCRPRLHLLNADDDDDEFPESPPPLALPSPDPVTSPSPFTGPQISLNALAGMPASEAFRIYGLVVHHQVIILVDGGSTHNFIQARLAAFLHLPQVSEPMMRVMIGNGNTIDCDKKCPQVPIIIQRYHFFVDLWGCTYRISLTIVSMWISWTKTLLIIIINFVLYNH